MAAPETDIDVLLSSQPTGAAARQALDAVRAAGGEASAFAVSLLARIERGEITHEQAITELTERYRAG